MCGSWGGYAVSGLNFYIAPRTNITTCGDCGQGNLCSYTCTDGWTCAASRPPVVTVSPPATLPIPFGNPGTFLNIYSLSYVAKEHLPRWCTSWLQHFLTGSCSTATSNFKELQAELVLCTRWNVLLEKCNGPRIRLL